MPDSHPHLRFVPVPTHRPRHDGWTAERQHDFIIALVTLGVVARAAAAVGMSSTSAYALRRRKGAEGFAKAWDDALFEARGIAFAIACDRGLQGYHTPIFYRGRQVGSRHTYDNRLLLAAVMHPPAPPASGPRSAAKPRE